MLWTDGGWGLGTAWLCAVVSAHPGSQVPVSVRAPSRSLGIGWPSPRLVSIRAPPSPHLGSRVPVEGPSQGEPGWSRVRVAQGQRPRRRPDGWSHVGGCSGRAVACGGGTETGPGVPSRGGGGVGATAGAHFCRTAWDEVGWVACQASVPVRQPERGATERWALTAADGRALVWRSRAGAEPGDPCLHRCGEVGWGPGVAVAHLGNQSQWGGCSEGDRRLCVWRLPRVF